jgi:iron complex outermembrane recepter protein
MASMATRITTAVQWALTGIGLSLEVSSAAVAQDTPAPSALGVEEVIVTARRREESLQDVPISMTAVTAAQLELRGAPDITDLQRSTPSLTLQVSRGTNSTLTSFIRGVGQQDPLWGFEPGVGLYVDDVYYARPQGAILDILEIDRIEVLRGPQGTLYGRNTIGGALKYVTKRLSDRPEFMVRAEAGTYDELNGIVSGSTPLGDTLRIGAAVGSFNRDGFGKNLHTGADHGLGRDVLTGRASLEWTPSDSFFVRAAHDRLKDDSPPYHGHREAPPAVLPGGVRVPATGGDVLPDEFDTNAGLTDENHVNTEGYSLAAEWTVSDAVTLKSISAYRKGDSGPLGIDFDNTPTRTLDVGAIPQPGASAGYQDDQFSQELQLVLSGQRWQGLFGIYYLDAMASGSFDTILAAGGLTQGTSGRVDTESFAAFADVSFDISDSFSASLGGRWTRDDKDGTVFKANYPGLGGPISGRNVAPAQILTNYTSSKTFEEFTPRASITWKVNPDANFYASYSRGFKSGGFDMRGDATAYPNTAQGYEPEIVDAYELGFKGLLAGGRMSLNAAIFDQEYQDQQVTTQFPGPPPSFVVSVVDNVGKSRIRGAELEATTSLTDALTMKVGASYLDAEFLEYFTFMPGVGEVDVADQRQIQNTPEWMGFLGFVYQHSLGPAGTLALSASAAYRDDVSMFETPVPLIDQEAYWLYDASVMWTSASESWRVGVYGRNLDDTRYRTGGYNFVGALFGNSVIGFYGPPRTVRASIEYRF